MRSLKNRLLTFALSLPFLLAPLALWAADLTVTAASVAPGSGATQTVYTAGAAITAGQVVYLDSSTGKVKLAFADTQAHAAAIGVAVCNAASGQPVVVQTAGALNPGATVVVGTEYVVSAAVAGNIAPRADLATTNWITSLGVATTASNLPVGIVQRNLQVP